MRSGAIEGIQDMGAAGLTSSSVEMADRAGTGLELYLDDVPQRGISANFLSWNNNRNNFV